MFTETRVCHTFCIEMQRHTRECEERQLGLDDREPEILTFADNRPGGWLRRVEDHDLPTFTTHQGALAYRPR